MAQQLSDREAKPQKLIDIVHEKMEKNEQFFSLEFYPPKTFNGATNLMAIIGRLNEHCTPLFCDITWKPSQDPMSDKCQPEPSTLLVSAAARDLYGQNIMIQIPSRNTTKSQVVEHLTRAKNLGIGSVLAVRGGISHKILKPSVDQFIFYGRKADQRSLKGWNAPGWAKQGQSIVYKKRHPPQLPLLPPPNKNSHNNNNNKHKKMKTKQKSSRS